MCLTKARTPPAGAPLFSVIIPVYNDPDGLRRCLRALAAQSLPVEQLEVLVVDNGSELPLNSIVSDFFFARYLREPRPGSYAARNFGLEHARGRYVAFTDADCLPDRHWLENGLRWFESHPDLSAVGGNVEIQTSGKPSAAEAYERVFGFRQQKYISENGFAVTANLLVDRRVINEIGPFDARLRSGGDRDWGHRLHMAGGRIGYAPDVLVRHPARTDTLALIRKRRRVQAGRNAVPALIDKLPTWQPVADKSQPAGLAMGAALLFRPSLLGLNRLKGIQAALVAVMLLLVGYLESARLKLGGRPLR